MTVTNVFTLILPLLAAVDGTSKGDDSGSNVIHVGHCGRLSALVRPGDASTTTWGSRTAYESSRAETIASDFLVSANDRLGRQFRNGERCKRQAKEALEMEAQP